jgi:hypothetical protein
MALGGMALTGRSGLPVLKASTSKEFQPYTRSIGVSDFSHHSSLIRGAPSSTPTSSVGKGGRHRSGERLGPPFRHFYLTARVGNGGERMRHDDTGIGQKPAPIAGKDGCPRAG